MPVQGNGSRPSLSELIADLSSADGLARRRARLALEKIGGRAVPPLITVLRSAQGPAHWEAAKALGQIRSPQAAPALVSALEDNEFSIRWLSAEALIALGFQGLPPLLDALVRRPISGTLREGAHHVLQDLVSKNYLLERHTVLVQPVLDALEGPEPAVAVPAVAQAALRQIQAESAAG